MTNHPEAPAASRRERIVEAAVEAFAERGFRGATTRDIADRAGTNQGLITYHFRSKDDLWRAAVDRIFELLQTRFGAGAALIQDATPRERAREQIRVYVRFVAAHPELFRFLVDEGKNSDERMNWLVDTHLRPRYESLLPGLQDALGEIDESLLPHAYYVLAGAASLMFAVAPECRRLTGLDPETEQVIERHAEFVANILVP